MCLWQHALVHIYQTIYEYCGRFLWDCCWGGLSPCPLLRALTSAHGLYAQTSALPNETGLSFAKRRWELVAVEHTAGRYGGQMDDWRFEESVTPFSRENSPD